MKSISIMSELEQITLNSDVRNLPLEYCGTVSTLELESSLHQGFKKAEVNVQRQREMLHKLQIFQRWADL